MRLKVFTIVGPVVIRASCLKRVYVADVRGTEVGISVFGVSFGGGDESVIG